MYACTSVICTNLMIASIEIKLDVARPTIRLKLRRARTMQTPRKSTSPPAPSSSDEQRITEAYSSPQSPSTLVSPPPTEVGVVGLETPSSPTPPTLHLYSPLPEPIGQVERFQSTPGHEGVAPQNEANGRLMRHDIELMGTCDEGDSRSSIRKHVGGPSPRKSVDQDLLDRLQLAEDKILALESEITLLKDERTLVFARLQKLEESQKASEMSARDIARERMVQALCNLRAGLELAVPVRETVKGSKAY
ncbi:hypothetical protein FRB99_005754 [Tulasnella sp. 403]|nr:hypothetical protein FRB99_005754 [Tulasnella sp. 403]